MELTDSLKREVGSKKSTGVVVAVLSLLAMIFLVIICIPTKGEAQVGTSTPIEDKMLKVQQDQVAVLKDIATELRKIRIELQKRDR